MKIWRVVNVKDNGRAELNRGWSHADSSFQRFLTLAEAERPVILNLPSLVVRETKDWGHSLQIFFPEER